MKKTFSEYLQKYILLNLNGVTEASCFAFSGIRNVHFCIMERPLFYIVTFLFQAKPFLFHSWELIWHILSLFLFINLCSNLSKNKAIAMFSGFLWSIHPTNTESIIWATNWPALLGITLYFYTLNLAVGNLDKKEINSKLIFLIFLLSIIQMNIVEHTISLPLILFLIGLQKLNNPLTALKLSTPALISALLYISARLISLHTNVNIGFHIKDQIGRIIFLVPQVFFHQLKIIFFPRTLTIDQLDLLTLDKSFLGFYHLFCLVFLILFITLAFLLWKRNEGLSLGLWGFLLSILPFIQIMPLYSVCAERYNYLASSFLIFGIISFLFTVFKSRIFTIIAISLVVIFGIRTGIRISDWKNSSTLFQSTIKSSKSLFKKGIWTYNLALSEEDQGKKISLIKESTELLNLFINNPHSGFNQKFLKAYELNTNSLITKAYLRIATNHEILGEKELQLQSLNKALELSKDKTLIRSTIYKNLGTYYFQAGDFNRAIYFYKKTYEAHKNPSVQFAIAACFLNLKDINSYEDYLKKAVQTITSDGKPFLAYGQFLELEKKNFTEAIKNYKIASVLEDSPGPYILLGTLYLKLNQIDNAYKVIQNGLYGHPNNSNLLYLRGAIYINKGKTTQGIKDLKKIVNNPQAQNDIKQEAYSILQGLNFQEKKDSL